jgi:hypothetical protein
MSHEYFDWSTIEDDIVVPEQAQIAVYNNPNGGVVCRQAGQYGPDEDSWIFFHPSHALALTRAILEKAGLDMEIVPLTSLLVQNREGVLLRPFPNQDVIDKLDKVKNAGRDDDQDDEDSVERKRKAAAERQRRRREKQRERDGVTEAVTERDADRDSVTTAPALPDELDFQGEQQARTH